MVDNVEASQSFQTNGFNKCGVPYCLTLKLVSKHLIDALLQATQMIIIIYNKDWHDRVTYQTYLGIFSFSLVPDKKLSFSPNIYLLSLLLAQFSTTESQIKYLLKMENLSNDHKGELHAYTSNNFFSQISNLVSNRDKVIMTDMKHA